MAALTLLGEALLKLKKKGLGAAIKYTNEKMRNENVNEKILSHKQKKTHFCFSVEVSGRGEAWVHSS